jgi:hypothetical protein
MSRVFLMKWYHFSVEYFEDLRNVNHCEFLIMRKSIDSGKYILENNLRTWSELKRERLAAAKEKEKKLPPSSPTTEREKEKKLEAAAATTAGPTHKKWGGCPNGCDHGKHAYKRENSMHSMFGRASLAPSPIPSRNRRWQNSSGDEEESDEPRARARAAFTIDVPASLDGAVSSPDGTPSFITARGGLLLVSAGRDFGGSESGNTSIAGSDTEGEGRLRVRPGADSGMGRGALADALGDQSDVGSDAASERDLEASVQGSVY